MSIRCFVAIELDEAVKNKLMRLQEGLQRELGPKTTGIRWLRANQMHLTLKFLGDVEDSRIRELCSAISVAASSHSPFDFEIENCGTFPPHRVARVLWVGISDPQQKLQALQKSVEDSLAEVDFPPEGRKYSAHLTLARIRQAEAGSRVAELAKKAKPFTCPVQHVTNIALIQSQLTSKGPIYVPMHHAELGKK